MSLAQCSEAVLCVTADKGEMKCRGMRRIDQDYRRDVKIRGEVGMQSLDGGVGLLARVADLC